MQYLSIVGLAFWLFLFFYMVPIISWIKSMRAGVNIGLLNLITMRLNKVPPKIIVDNAIRLKENDISFDARSIKLHYLKGGNVNKVTEALLKAKSNCVDLTYGDAASLELERAQDTYRR